MTVCLRADAFHFLSVRMHIYFSFEKIIESYAKLSNTRQNISFFLLFARHRFAGNVSKRTPQNIYKMYVMDVRATVYNRRVRSGYISARRIVRFPTDMHPILDWRTCTTTTAVKRGDVASCVRVNTRKRTAGENPIRRRRYTRGRVAFLARVRVNMPSI